MRRKTVTLMTTQPVEILLVEDNEDDVLIIQEASVESSLLNVIHTVSDGEEALAYLRREWKYREVAPPGLVLLAINMQKRL